MPNDELIARLDKLREDYTQQQKAVAALQSALKSTLDVQNKTQRALRELAALDRRLDLGAAQDVLDRLRLRESLVDPLLPELRRELKSLTTVNGGLREASTALRGEPADVIRLDKALKVLQASKLQEAADLLPELAGELDLAQRRLGDEFGHKLRAALEEEGVQVGGRPPRFELGRYELEANFAGRSITLRYGKDTVVPRAPATVEAAVKFYLEAARAISGRNQDGQGWIAQFYDAYTVARRKRGAETARVNIVDCYIELVLLRQGRSFAIEPSKRTFSDYTRAQFSYDFYEFTNRERRVHNGQLVRAHSATKSQTDSPAKSMWIVEGDGPYDGRFIADVEFVKE